MRAYELIRCPRDGAEIVWNASGTEGACVACGATLKRQDGVYSDGAAGDEFYEGRYLAHVRYLPRSERPWHAWPLWLLNSGYLWAVRKALPEEATVVELGCGGGISYFGRRFRMIGLDLSRGSLQRAAQAYAIAMQCDVTSRLPLADASVDGIISNSFFEHIKPSRKGHLVRECQRVLKPRGRLIFLYDVETANPLIRRMRGANEAKYKSLFLDSDGHVGYETFRRNITYFEEAGLQVDSRFGIEKTPFVATSALVKLGEWPGFAGRLFQAGRALNRRTFNLIYASFLRTIDCTVGRGLPHDWSRMALTVCTKPATPGALLSRKRAAV